MASMGFCIFARFLKTKSSAILKSNYVLSFKQLIINIL